MKKIFILVLAAAALISLAFYGYLESVEPLPNNFLTDNDIVAPSDIRKYDVQSDRFVDVEQNSNISAEISSYVFSFIIPVHNTEQYIEGAVESIVTQNINSYEILLIENNSTDNTLQACKNLAKKYREVKLFTQVNGGAGGARNTGILHSNGQYILFLDSDDFYVPGAINQDEIISHEQYDVIIFGLNYVDIRNDSVFYYVDVKLEDNKSFHAKDLHTGDIRNLQMIEKAQISMCNKIFKRKFLLDNQIFFVNHIRYEDYYAALKFYTSDFSFFVIDKPLFNYRVNRADSQSNSAIKMFEIFYILDEFEKYLKESGKYEEFRDAMLWQEFEQLFYRLYQIPLKDAYQWLKFLRTRYDGVELEFPKHLSLYQRKFERLSKQMSFRIMIFHVIPKRIETSFKRLTRRDISPKN